MTQNEFRSTLDYLGITQAQAAEWMDLSLRTVHGYCNGTPIPRVVEFALIAMRAAITEKRIRELTVVRSSQP